MIKMSNPQGVINKAKKLLSLRRNDLHRKYGASGSSVGYKIEGGKFTEKVALIFYVKKKKSDRQLRYEGVSPIPKKIDGIPTDVVVLKKGFRPK